MSLCRGALLVLFLLVVGVVVARPVAAGDDDTTRVEIRPYREVVTRDAQSMSGLFMVHRVKDRLLYEIPARALGRDMVLVTSLARTQSGSSVEGTTVSDCVVRWERFQDRVLLRNVDYRLRADARSAVHRAVQASSLAPVIMAFDIRALGPHGDVVIDVTPLYTLDVPELSARKQLEASALDPKRTFVQRVRAFPTNVEVDVLATYGVIPTTSLSSAFALARSRESAAAHVATSAVATSAVLHHSLVLLPEVPMRPRLADSRVGYFQEAWQDYGRGEHSVVERRYVTRWRLDKKDPAAAVSEPVKPIVLHIGSEVPEKWRPYIKQAVEDWQGPFEAAGFRNAIVARQAPAPGGDWDPDDARYSVIRWLSTSVENAESPHVHDPRSGEILNGTIHIHHNALKMLTSWYFVQASPCDPRAQHLPLPDELMGELVRYVVSHEVGHTLGLQHNMKASAAFTVDQLRDLAFTARWGTEASIMAYGRFNYVAQPGDGARLIPRQGPYDYFAIEWGYRPAPAGEDVAGERAFLDQIASRQVENPWLRFGNPDGDIDPTRQIENLGSDPVAATRLGLANLDRVLSYLVPAVCRPGRGYEDLEAMYGEVVLQRVQELGHVAALVGGVVQTDWHYGHSDRVYAPVPETRQREAVRFLLEHCFRTPRALLHADILYRIKATGAAEQVLTMQATILRQLVNDEDFVRMSELVALNGGGYSPEHLMDDLRAGLWTELHASRVEVDSFRRRLQRLYVDHLVAFIASGATTRSDLRALSRASLVRLQQEIDLALVRHCDRITAIHLRDCEAVIRRALWVRSTGNS